MIEDVRKNEISDFYCFDAIGRSFVLCGIKKINKLVRFMTLKGLGKWWFLVHDAACSNLEKLSYNLLLNSPTDNGADPSALLLIVT